MTQSIDIQIPAIEKELAGLSGQLDKKQHKACLFTLIIYVHEARLVNYLQELVDTILDKFPCRIIFIYGDNQSEKPYLHASVSNVMSGQANGKSGSLIACDQISIKVSKDQLFRVPYLVTPYIVPDLPVYLLWGQNPFEERDIFPHLQPYASRLVFDSECASSLQRFCLEMEKGLKVLKMDVMDINWALVSNWRDILTNLFDTPEKISELSLIKSVSITYTDNKSETRLHPEIRAIYLQGWLAARLKWRYRLVERFQKHAIISYFTNNTPVVVSLTPQANPELPSGAITGVEITMTDGRSYYLARKEHFSQVVVHASSKETCDLPYTLPLSNVNRGLAFMKEIFFSQLGDHYQEMLQSIAQIDYKILNQ